MYELGNVLEADDDGLGHCRGASNDHAGGGSITRFAKSIERWVSAIRMSIDDKDKDIRAKILPFNDRLAEDWRGIFA